MVGEVRSWWKVVERGRKRLKAEKQEEGSGNITSLTQI